MFFEQVDSASMDTDYKEVVVKVFILIKTNLLLNLFLSNK